MPTPQDVLNHRLVASHLQPIVSVKKRAVIGLEALARPIRGGQPFEPSLLFNEARIQGLNDSLDELCLEQALLAFTSIAGRPQDLALFINLDAARLQRGQLSAQTLARTMESFGLNPRDVVLEFSDSHAEDAPGLRVLVESCQSLGFSVALDNVDGSPGSLRRITLLEPEVVKADRNLVQGMAQDPVRQALLGAVASCAHRLGALLVVEGVESEDDAMACLDLGSDLLQGYHYGRPAEPERVNAAQAQNAAIRSAERMKANLAGRQLSRRRENERHLLLLERIKTALAAAAVSSFGAVLEEFVNAVASLECLYVLDAKGRQVTPTVVWRHQRDATRSRLFSPAHEGADHSLKDYFLGLTLQEQPHYISEPYVSLATGNLCRTLTARFEVEHAQEHVLCMDIRSA